MLAIVLLTLTATDWPQWRGPNRDAVAVGAAVAQWPAKLTARWKIEIGEGHSSPIFAAGRVYTFARQKDQEVVRAIDPSTGKTIWQQAYAAPYEMSPVASAHGKGPKSTPVFANGRVYTFGIHGVLGCWDAATGKPVWKHDFKGSPEFGTAMSPLVSGNSVIVHGPSGLAALDAVSGKQQWSWTEDGPAYASPVAATVDGTPQVITQTRNHLVAVDARSGRSVWKVPFKTAYEQNSVSPVVRDGVLIYSGLDRGLTAAKLTAKGPQTIWTNDRYALYMNSPVWRDGRVCGFTHKNKGQLFCRNDTNGQPLWTSPPRLGDNAAMILLGDMLLALTDDAKLRVLKWQPRSYEALREYDAAPNATWAHPAPVPGGLLVKDVHTLYFYPL